MRVGANRIRYSRPVQLILFVGCLLGAGRIYRSVYHRIMADAKKTEGALPKSPESKGPGLSGLSGLGINREEDYNFPKSLKEFGYEFNENGELRSIKNDEPYEFKVKEDHKYNQKRYEALGEIITDAVYELLESEGGLKRLELPVDAEEEEAKSFIFVSDDYETNKDKLMVLIHGSGVVRAGQWARRLIINDHLKAGTQLPFIERAKQEGYAVVVLNSNLNTVEVNGKEHKIRENSQPEHHGTYVWQNIISKLPAKHIAIVAHSYGGIVTTITAGKNVKDFEKRVFAIAFTDSVHSLEWQQAPEPIVNLYKRKSKNWVSSDEPIDTPVRMPRNDSPRISAGHEKHEWTSYSAFPSIFKFFAERYADTTQKSDL